jgi:hypothetical protein
MKHTLLLPIKKQMRDRSKAYVVHVKKEEYDVYIGRPSKWANPYTHKELNKTLAKEQVSSRSEAIKRYELYLTQSGLIDEIEELKGKILGCWCCDSPSDGSEKNLVCHGQVLAKILNQDKNDNQIQLL